MDGFALRFYHRVACRGFTASIKNVSRRYQVQPIGVWNPDRSWSKTVVQACQTRLLSGERLRAIGSSLGLHLGSEGISFEGSCTGIKSLEFGYGMVCRIPGDKRWRNATDASSLLRKAPTSILLPTPVQHTPGYGPPDTGTGVSHVQGSSGIIGFTLRGHYVPK